MTVAKYKEVMKKEPHVTAIHAGAPRPSAPGAQF